MQYSQEIYKARYPKATIAEGAHVAETCRIDEGCQISPEADIGHYLATMRDVKVIGGVKIDRNAVIREDTTLIGPLQIGEGVIVARGCRIGTNRPDEIPPNQPTIIEKNCLIGKGVEIIGGLHLGERVRVRAGSRVFGDVPSFAIVARSPAILERFACPACGGGLYVKSGSEAVTKMACTSCRSEGYRFDTKLMTRKQCRGLLPNDSEGEQISTLGDDPAWRDVYEMA